jgi:hypothetical protein
MSRQWEADSDRATRRGALDEVRAQLARGKRVLGQDFCAEDEKVRVMIIGILRAEGWTVTEEVGSGWYAKCSRTYTDADVRRALQRSPGSVR